MDDGLIQRWNDGDGSARIAVRNGIRGVAERVLGHPGLHRALGKDSNSPLLDETRRREETARIAIEVMERSPQTAAQATAMALLVGGRKAVVELQQGRPVTTESHLPAQSTVTYALAETGMPGPLKAAVERHLSNCAACAEDVRILRSVVRTQEAVDHEVEAPAIHDEFGRETREEAPDLGPLLAARIKEAEEAASADIAEEVIEKVRQSQRRGPRPKPRIQKDRRKQEKGPGIVALLLPFVGLALVFGGLWWFLGGRDKSEQATLGTVASLADRSPADFRGGPGDPVGSAQTLKLLREGQCVTAAGKLRAARRQQPDLARLYMWEGAAWVCASKGDKAMAVFDAFEAAKLEEPKQLAYYRAQARLLTGDLRGAVEDLDRAVSGDNLHRDQAAIQLAQAKGLMGR